MPLSDPLLGTACVKPMQTNLDHRVVKGFGEEWACFDQQSLSGSERQNIFDQYFGIFPWSTLPVNAVGFDLGCGSGRWARVVGPRVGMLHCIDASDAALNVAKQTLRQLPNCTFHHASVDAIPLDDNSMDFGYSLGVLHHMGGIGLDFEKTMFNHGFDGNAFPFGIKLAPARHTVNVHMELGAGQLIELIPRPAFFFFYLTPHTKGPGGGIEMWYGAIMQHRKLQG